MSARSVTEPDLLVYCRVPRGGRSCAATQTFALPYNGLATHVEIAPSGAVVLVAVRCCGSPLGHASGTPAYALTSADGGTTFSTPVQISERFYGAGQEVAFGPGDFSVSLVGGFGGGNEGVIYQSAQLGTVDEAAADLTNGDWTKAFYPSVGFVDPLTPLVAYTGGPSGTPSRIYFRLWGGSGSYDDVATWGPETLVPGGGSEAKLASGPRGVFLVYQGLKPPYQYFVRRYEAGNFPKSSQTVVSDPRSGQSAIFRDLFEDRGGNLHAAFRQRSKRGVTGLRQRTSVDGAESWDRVEVLAGGPVADDLFNLRVGAAPDAGGAVVGDHNSKGPIWFAPFRPAAGSGKGSCSPTVKLGKAVARALKGCFSHKKGGGWVAGGPVKLNGVDIEPAGGGGKASASGAFHVTASPGARTLVTSGAAKVRVGKVVLEKGKVAWKLPAGDGKVVRVGAADGTVFHDLGQFAKKLFDLPVDGDAELLIKGEGAAIPVNLRMPALIGGVTGKTVLHTNQEGQVLGGMKIDVPTAAIGPLHIASVHLSYAGENEFAGGAEILLPPAYAKPVKVSFAIDDGDLIRLDIDPLIQFVPTLPIVGSPPSPLVGLDEIGFSYVRKPASRLFTGNLVLVAGPKLFGLRIVDLDGTVALEFPESAPSTLTANGELHVVRVPLANAFARYTVGLPGSLEFGGSFEVEGIGGSVHGYVDLANGDFSASGKAGIGPLSGEVVMNQDGFGACIPNPFGEDPGFGWKWGAISPSYGCPGSGVLGRASSATAAAAGPPPALVRAKVGGKGRRRSLRFRVRRSPGQRVTFAEESGRVYREIGSSAKGRGTLKFHPAPGPGGRRRIVAVVEQGGVPWAKLTVARYKAPPLRRLRAPRRARARRSGSKLVVAWAAVKGAKGYEVRVDLPRDGRRLLFFPPAKRHRLRVKGLERSDLARVRVAAIGADLRPGRTAKAKLKPAKRKHRKGKRRKR